jgi:hypothetical protein
MGHAFGEVLIIRPGALGDTLMLLPLLAALEGVAGTVAAGRRPGIEVLRSRGIRCEDVEAGGWHALFEERPDARPPAVADLRPRRVLAFLNDADGRVGRNLEALFPEAGIRVFPGRPREAGSVHAALHLARCADRAGLPVDPDACVSAAAGTPLLRPGSDRGERTGLVVHPGSGGRRKNLSFGFWSAFLDRIQGRVETTLLLGPAEEPLLPRFESRISGKALRAAFSPDTAGLLSLLGRAACCVGHDSGISHLAAMLGTPTVALFKESDARVWRPLGPEVQVIEAHPEDAALMGRVVRAVEEGVRGGLVDGPACGD